MRAHDLERSVWGVRQTGAALTLRDRCLLFAARLPPNAFFSHSTAALLLGAPLPLLLERAPVVHVGVASPGATPHARGIRGHRLAIDPNDIVTDPDGLRRTSAERTWCDLGATLALDDLVAVGDYFVHWQLPLTTAALLEQHVNDWASRRGSRILRAGVPLLNDRSESRPESKLRVLLVMAGLPEPQVNLVIVEAESGRHVRTDLAFIQEMLLIEYQGDYHRTTEQWRKDMTRKSRLEALGWYVMEINADDLRDAAGLVQRIAGVLDRRASTARV